MSGRQSGCYRPPQPPPPQPNLPADGQELLVWQLSQALAAALGTRAAKVANPLRGRLAPQAGQLLATSNRLRAR